MAANHRSEPEVPVDTFIVFMREVLRCESALRELNLMWRLIESSAKMNCPEEARALLPMMQATREGLQRLEGGLVQSLVAQSLSEVLAELRTSAHHVIDSMSAPTIAAGGHLRLSCAACWCRRRSCSKPVATAPAHRPASCWNTSTSSTPCMRASWCTTAAAPSPQPVAAPWPMANRCWGCALKATPWMLCCA